MRYKVTNESASTKVLPAAAPGTNVFFKPGVSREVDLRPMTSAQIKKFSAVKLYVEEAGLADLIAAATAPVAAEVALPPPSVTEPTPAPAAPPPSKPAPAAKAPSAAPTEGVPPAPEPWQKGLEPPK